MGDHIWDGRLSKVNISDQSYPELFEELSKVSPRARSERLKSLAMFGLMYLRNSQTGAAGGAVNRVTESVEESILQVDAKKNTEKLEKAKKEIKGRLLQTIPTS